MRVRPKLIDRRAGSGLPSVTPMTGPARYPLKSAGWPRAGRTFVIALLVILASSAMARVPRSQRHERRHQIDRLEEVWRNALLKNDAVAMRSLLAEDYMGITPTGTLQTKEEALTSLRRAHFTTLEISDRKIRFYGTTALVTSTADVEAATPDGNLSGSYRYTRVYVEGPPGVWKIVSFEANRILSSRDHDHK